MGWTVVQGWFVCLADLSDSPHGLQRQKTVETLVVRPELRSPPWFVQHPTLGVDDEFLSVHWATLFLDATKTV